jgi:hypothetical protein
MLTLARKAHPKLRFMEDRGRALRVLGAFLAGSLARYSLIRTPPEDVPEILTGFRRARSPGAHLLVAFFATPQDATLGFDHKVAWDSSPSIASFAAAILVGRVLRSYGSLKRSQTFVGGPWESSCRGQPLRWLPA